MNVTKEQICRLCLKVIDNDYEIIDEIKTKMFEVLLLRANLDVSKDPVVCKDCAEILRKCFDFKSVCMNTEQIIVSFASDKKGTTFELKDVFNPSNDRKGMETGDDNSICRFCSNHSSESNFVLLDTLMKDITFAKMFQVLLIPEMDFNVVKNPVICISCKEDLDCYMKFVENCLEVEGKITKYCHNAAIPTSSQVVSNEILRFLSKNSADLDYTQINAVKQEVKEEASEDIGEEHAEAYDGDLLKTEEELDIKECGVNLHEAACEKLIDAPEYKLYIPHGIKMETGVKETWTPDSSFTATTANYGDFMRDTLIPHRDIKSDTQSNKVSTEIEMEKTFKSKSNRTFNKKKKPMPSIKNAPVAQIFNCAVCNYETKLKSNFKRHMLIHKDVTQVEMYKCASCTYETKQKGYLKKHMIIHKNIREVEMYKCSMCPFQAKQNSNLKQHILIHKNITEVEIHKCSLCIFETKHKNSLKSHTLIHKHVTELEIYKCLLCTYEAKQKGYLKKHMIIHKNSTEVKMYKCSICIFETKHRKSLKSHMLLHRDVTEVEMYKCSMCIFETKHKTSLTTHMLIHKDIREVEMYKCSLCAYETKKKGDLNKHTLIHRNNTDVEMYKCSMCTYMTKRKDHLNRHMMIHKNGNV